MHIIWTIIIGFIAGVIAKFITPGKNEPSGFILTTILGIAGAFLATYLGHFANGGTAAAGSFDSRCNFCRIKRSQKGWR